jgi:hypothetical protein
MGLRKKGDNKHLNKLVSDCITYRLHENEALEYIEKEFGESISKRSYWRRRANLQSPTASKAWINWFSRIGFVQLHQKQIDDIITILEDSFQTLHKLTHQKVLGKIGQQRGDENLILKIKESIMESEKLLIELGLGTPVIAGIKKRIEDAYAGHFDLDNNKTDSPSFDVVDSYRDWYSRQ